MPRENIEGGDGSDSHALEFRQFHRSWCAFAPFASFARQFPLTDLRLLLSAEKLARELHELGMSRNRSQRGKLLRREDLGGLRRHHGVSIS